MSIVPTEQRKKVQAQNLGCLSILLLLVVFAVIYFVNRKPSANEASKQDVKINEKLAEAYKTDNENPYQKIEVVFTGSPAKSQVQPMLEAVMKKYNIEITDEKIMQVANMLFVLKKDSKVGVTEMEILKHIYQHGSEKTSLPEQAAVSSTLLEKYK